MNEQTTCKRPQFLTILCILSFAGITLTFFSEIITWFAIQKQVQMASAAEASLAAAMQHDLVARKLSILIGASTVPICLVGVWMMWTLKKIGFYIYTFGEMALPISAMFYIGFSGPAIQTASMLANAIISASFVFMYALNLKYMK